MKYIILYRMRNQKVVVEFANSLEKFIEANNRKQYPYDYDITQLNTYKLHSDVFARAMIEGQSNFKDYLR